MKAKNVTKWIRAATVAAALAVGMVGCGGKGGGQAGTFTDTRDGQTYRTVVMPDGKTWMAKNLNHQTDSSWCYGDAPANCEKYGRLYTWKAAIEACAGLGGGWRLPSHEEWMALTEAVGGWRTAGTKLKSKTGWIEDEGYIPGTDDFGFSALPGGYRWSNGRFRAAGSDGYWWTATEDGASYAYSRDVNYDNEGVYSGWDYNKSFGFSLRCLQD